MEPRRRSKIANCGARTQWLHTHLFEEADGGTTVRDEVRYRLRGPDLVSAPINSLLVAAGRIAHLRLPARRALEQALGARRALAQGPVSISAATYNPA